MGLRHALLLSALLGAEDASLSIATLRTLPRWGPFPTVARPAEATPAPPALVRLPEAFQLEVDRTVEAAVRRRDLPGAVVVAGSREGVWFRRAYGRLAVEPVSLPMPVDAVFDLASVTKAVATATSIARLVEQHRLHYDDPVARWVPAFDRPDKAGITLRALLTHTSGLPADNRVEDEAEGLEHAVSSIARLPLGRPGVHVYSDLGFIVLAEVVRRAAGVPLDRFVEHEIFAPLGMRSTGYHPRFSARLVPTERDGDRFLRGVVHDPRARALGGVAGHAGLFSSADDLARFARALLFGGVLDGARVLEAETVARMTRPIALPDARVTLGWDSPDDPDASAWSAASFGHDGFTGTSLWIDPVADRFVVLLSSRLHPDGRGRAAPLGNALRRIFARARPTRVARPIECGIDRLAAEGFRGLGGRRVAFLTHSAARDRWGRRSLDVAYEALGSRLVRVLTPEHGLDARHEGRGPDTADDLTGLPTESVYAGAIDAALRGVDTLLVDLVDAGVRFYTYEGSVLAALRAAARQHVKVVVLDRPNPLDGETIEGPTSDPAPRSLVNPFELPIRHGMTLGELSRLFVSELSLATDVHVVTASGWRRRERFDPSRQQWFAPSPNLRSPVAAELYPGIALFETTNLSVGRGTEKPFELLGAPWLDASRLVRDLRVPGVVLRPTEFVPNAGPHRGEHCRGVSFRIDDPGRFRPVDLGFAIAAELVAHQSERWQRTEVGLLLGSREVALDIERGADAGTLGHRARRDADAFRLRRAPYLLYE
jgi:uncharacterized protein YbbC (DUF1343 family)